jgi:4-nitrophenyl phosphatase
VIRDRRDFAPATTSASVTVAGAIIDLDGTVYRGGTLLPGADRAIGDLRERGIDTLFVSNNPTKPPEGYAADLAGMGIDAAPETILTAGVVTREYLAANHADDRLFLIGEDALREQLAAFTFTGDPARAEVVVASIDREFTYDRLWEVSRAFTAGDPAFVGTDPDRLIPVNEDGLAPGSGAIVGAIAATVGRDPDPMLGKPSPETARAVEDRLDADPGACVVVGDRLDTDVALGERLGARTVLVRTGAHDEDDIETGGPTPDHVIDALGDLPAMLDAV